MHIDPKTRIYVIFGTAATIALLILAALIFRKPPLPQSASENTVPGQTVITPPPMPQDIFLTQVPRHLPDLSVSDLPDIGYVSTLAETPNRLWFASGGSIIEYDTIQNKIVSYTNSRKAGRCTSITLVGNHLYIACATNKLPAFQNYFIAFNKEWQYDSNYIVLKVNPEDRRVVRMFTPSDGLHSTENYDLYADEEENTVWIGTFDGVGRIDTLTDKVSFFQKELGVPGNQFVINSITIDRALVWAEIGSNDQSKGGVSVYDPETKKWNGFGAESLKEVDHNYGINLEKPVKPEPLGGKIVFRDGAIGSETRYMEKLYDAYDERWSTVATGALTPEVQERIDREYPDYFYFTKPDDLWFYQLSLPDGPSFPTNGRLYFALSPRINDKWYALSSASLDVIDPSSPFPRILVKLRESIPLRRPAGETQSPDIAFAVDPAGEFAYITAVRSLYRPYCDTRDDWLIDLKTETVLRVYPNLPGFYTRFDSLTLKPEDDTLIVTTDKNIPLVRIDLPAYTRTHIEPTPTITPTPTPR